MAHIPTPSLFDLIKQRTADQDAARDFFNIKVKAGPRWLESIAEGVDAAQRVLSAYMSEQTGQPTSQAIAPNVDSEQETLLREIFGEGYMQVMRNLSSSIKSKSRIVLEFLTEDGKTRLRATAPEPVKEAEPIESMPELVEDTQTTDVAQAEKMALGLLSRRVNVDGEPTLLAVLSAILAGQWRRDVQMLLPMYSDINPHIHFSHLAQVRKQPWLGVSYEANTVIQRARNILAQRFLESEAEWSFWLDDDVAAPFGDLGFFYAHDKLGADPGFIKPEFVNVMTVDRLRKAGKTIVGGVYQMRRSNARMVIQPHLHPRDQEDKDLVEKLLAHGPQDKVVKVGYVATGCALIHRKVYEDIMLKFPERAPKKEGEPFDFFGHDVGVGGEDIAFCNLARQAGHESFLDLGLWCGHIGNYAFFPPRALR